MLKLPIVWKSSWWRDYFFPCHKFASVSFATMANVYGMTYDPSCSDAGPSPAVNSNTDNEPTTTTSSTRKFKSRIHREGYEMDMQRKEKKRLKTEEKAQKLTKKNEREKKKDYIANGCGSKNLFECFAGQRSSSSSKLKSRRTTTTSPSNKTVSTVSSSVDSPMAVTADVGQVEVEEVEVAGTKAVEEVSSTLPDDFVCLGCGNEKALCHQKLFGTFLVQDAITFYNNSLLSEKEVDLSDDAIHALFKDKYPDRLQAYVMFEHHEYDEKLDYDLPVCLVEGALKMACTLVRSRKTLDTLSLNRRYGASYCHFMFSGEHLALSKMNE